VINRYTGSVTAAAAAFILGACAVRLGGPSPELYNAVALSVAPDASAAEVASALTAGGAEIVLLAADQDSAWFASVATSVGLELSGPGRTSGRGMAFMTDLEILGDTSLSLNVPGGGRVHMHDALYKIDEYRNLDLMMIKFDAPDIRAAVTTLLGYFATDVGADAAVVLAMDAPTPQLADSAAVLMRAHISSARECQNEPEISSTLPVRLLYGPSARVTCPNARVFGGTSGIAARIQVER
jgi:hypothetical protein